MNERIKELAEQVYGSAHYDDFKFAELIVAQNRPWVGLTDEEVDALQDFAYADDVEFIRNVENKLKEKNSG
jgi:hypothetical protein